MSFTLALTHATTVAMAFASRTNVVFDIEMLAVMVPVPLTPYSRTYPKSYGIFVSATAEYKYMPSPASPTRG